MSTERIQIMVNGKPHEAEPGQNLADLLGDLNLSPRAVVVELNREIVRRNELEDRGLAPGDSIELVHFVGGG